MPICGPRPFKDSCKDSNPLIWIMALIGFHYPLMGIRLIWDSLSSQRGYHSTGKPMCPARELTFLRSTPAPGDLLEQQAGLSPMWSHYVLLLMPFMLSLPYPFPSNVFKVIKACKAQSYLYCAILFMYAV